MEKKFTKFLHEIQIVNRLTGLFPIRRKVHIIMSLIISMEDVSGQDVNIEVYPEETFGTFLARASELLGYQIELSSITGDHVVSLLDNIYQFLIGIADPNEDQQNVEYVDKNLVDSDNFITNGEMVVDSQQLLESYVSDQDIGLQTENLGIDEKLTDNPSCEDFLTSQNNMYIDSEIPAQNSQSYNQQLLDINNSFAQPAEEIQKGDNTVEVVSNVTESNLQTENKTSVGNNTDDDSMSDIDDEDIEFLEEHLEEEEEDFSESLYESDYTEKGTILESKTNKLKEKGVQILSVFDIPRNDNNVANIFDNTYSETEEQEKIDTKKIQSYSQKLTEKNVVDLGDEPMEQELPILENSSDDDFMEIEFLDEVILEEDAKQIMKVQEEEKKKANSIPDLEDDIDTYTIVKHSNVQKNIESHKPQEQNVNSAKPKLSTPSEMDKEFDKILMNCENDTNFKQKNEPTEKHIYTQKQLLDLLEGSDSDGTNESIVKNKTVINKSVKAKESSGSSGSVSGDGAAPKMKKINPRNDYLSEYEKSTKLISERLMKSAIQDSSCRAQLKKSGGYQKEKKHKNSLAKSQPKNIIAKSSTANSKIDCAKNIKKEPAESQLYDDDVEGDIGSNEIESYTCRLCDVVLDRLQLAITHTMVHKLPDRAIYPCIVCQYGFTSFPEVRNHMKQNHKEKKIKVASEEKTKNGVNQNIAIERMGPLMIKTEPQDEWIDEEDGEQDIELLEEWLDDEIEDAYKETIDRFQGEGSVKKEKNEYYPIKREYEDADDPDPMESAMESDEWRPRKSAKQQYLEDALLDMALEKKSSKTNMFQCQYCRKKFDGNKAFRTHAEFCTKKGGEESFVKYEIEECGEVVEEERESHRCALCGQAFHTTRRLQFHRSLHQAELIAMALKCQECEKMEFSTESSLYDHINEVHNHLFKCKEPSCGKEFHLRSSLGTHSRVHGKRRHKCDVCFKQFYDTQNLKEHKVTHLKIKPFQCHICLKFLNRRSRLRMHLLAHESKPQENAVLSCKHCHMAFRDVEHAQCHIIESEECRLAIDPSQEDSILDLLKYTPSLQGDKCNTESELVTMDTENLLGDSLEQEIEAFDKLEDKKDSLLQTVLDENLLSDLKQNDQTAGESNCDIKTVEDYLTSIDVSQDALNEISQTELTSKAKEFHNIDNTIEDKGNVAEVLESVNDDDILENNAGQYESQMEIDNTNPSESSLVQDSNMTNELMKKSESEVTTGVCSTEQQQDSTMNKPKRKKSQEELSVELGPTLGMFIDVLKLKMIYRCEYCERVYSKIDALNSHREEHKNVELPYTCNVCSQTFVSYARVTSHKMSHGFYRCNDDDDEEEGTNNIQHKNDTVREKSVSQISGYEEFPVVKYFLCEVCNKTFLHYTYLSVHMKKTHGDPLEIFKCKICGEVFFEVNSFNYHKKKFHPEERSSLYKKCAASFYRCADCGENFDIRKDLAKHRDETHGDNSLLQFKTKPGPFVCTVCDKIYQTKIGLEGHMRHHGGGQYLCDLCGNGFANRAVLDNHHKRIHLRRNSFWCDTCGQSFFTSAELECHVRCHTGEKPFPCFYCPMAFRTKGRRNEHHRVHTGERPYSCDVCGLAFRRSHAMKNHRLIHTGLRPYVCPYCGKLFHIRSNLNTHVKQKHSSQFFVLKIQGGAETRAALEESLNSLSSISSAVQSSDGQEILISVESTSNQGDEAPIHENVSLDDQYIVYHPDGNLYMQQENGEVILGEHKDDNINILQYQVEEVSGDDGQIQYQVKYVDQ